VTWEGIRDQVIASPRMLKAIERIIAKAPERTGENLTHRLTTAGETGLRIQDQPPLLLHLPELDIPGVAQAFLESYGTTLREDVRSLFSRLRFVDAALKVVGVGSVGTRCYIALMLGEQNEPVFLQIKEARRSVIAPPGKKALWGHNGERVVVGQR